MGELQKQFDEIKAKLSTSNGRSDGEFTKKNFNHRNLKKSRFWLGGVVLLVAIAAVPIGWRRWQKNESAAVLMPTAVTQLQYQQALDAYQKGRFLETSKILESLKGAPELQTAIESMLGTSALAQDNLPEAEKYLLVAVRAEPTNPIHYNNLGALYLKKNDLTLAEATLRQGLEVGAPVPELYLNFAMVLEKSGKYDEAAKSLQDFLLIEKPDSQRWQLVRDRLRILRSLSRGLATGIEASQ